MKLFIIYKWHRDNGKGVIAINEEDSPVRIIEIGQKNMARQGLPTSITWQIHKGNFVSAIVASHKL